MRTFFVCQVTHRISPIFSSSCERCGANPAGASKQSALHHREVHWGEAASRAGQDEVPDPRPCDRG